MPDRCAYSDLPADTCHHCQEPPTSDPNPTPTSSRPFTARHDGTCRGCSFDIRPGETVRYLADALHHVRCADGR